MLLKMLLNKKAIVVGTVMFIIYWPLFLLGVAYSHAMTWDGAKTVNQKIILLLLKPLNIIPGQFILNALLWGLLGYAITILILRRKTL